MKFKVSKELKRISLFPCYDLLPFLVVSLGFFWWVLLTWVSPILFDLLLIAIIECLEKFGPQYFDIDCSQMFFLVIFILLWNQTQVKPKSHNAACADSPISLFKARGTSNWVCMYFFLLQTIIKVIAKYFKKWHFAHITFATANISQILRKTAIFHQKFL